MSVTIQTASKKRDFEPAQRPLPFRVGEFTLFFFFISMLAGRFTLDRLFEKADGIDLRSFYLGFGILTVLIWLNGARKYLPQKAPMAGSIPLLWWGAWMVLSATWAPFNVEAGKAIADFAFMLAFVLLAWLVMSMLPADSLEQVWKWLIIVGLIYFALALVSGPDIQGRYSAPGGGPNTFVRIMVLASIAAFYQAVVKKKNLALITIPIFIVGALLSGSRGGLLSAAIVLVVFFVPLFKLLRVKRSTALLVVTGVISVPAFQWNDGYLWKFVEERFIDQTFQDGYYSSRDVIAEQTVGMYFDNPIIGVGLAGFSAYQEGISVGHAHNLVLSVLAESGTIGGLLLAALVIRQIFAARDAAKIPSVLFPLVAGLYFLATSMFSGDYYDSRFVWFFLGLAAITAARFKIDERGVRLQ